MIKQEFRDLCSYFESIEHDILDLKGKDYTQGSEDILKNFKTTARALVPVMEGFLARISLHSTLPREDTEKLAIKVVWYTFFKKHLDAILSYLCSGVVESEGLVGRITDARNYLLLGAAIFKEWGDIELPTKGGDKI